MIQSLRSRRSRVMIALAAALFFVASVAEARPGRGGGGGPGFGSRGDRTYQAPPPTNTAPTTAAPINRSTTPAQQPGATNPGVRGQQAAPAANRGGIGRGGFLGGMIGAGLIGMLLGYGLMGGLGGFASIIGLLLQVLLIGGLIWLVVRFFRSRSRPQPAYAGAGAPLNREAVSPRAAGAGVGGGGAAGARRPQVRDEIGIGQADYEEFQRLLGTIQTAYGQEDYNGLQASTTPEVLGYFTEELNENTRRGVVNRVSDVTLLQGDLAEAWREGNSEYATVAMRYSLKDVTVDRATGKIVEGDPNQPVEATEIWTFARPRGGRWVLSAIQQVQG